MAKKIITGNKSAKASKAKVVKATKLADGRKARKDTPTKGKKVNVVATKKTTGLVKKIQHDKVGELVFQQEYKRDDVGLVKVYRFSPALGHRYQLEESKKQGTEVYKFSPSGRKFRIVDEVNSLQTALRRIKQGTYRKTFM